MSSQHHEAKWTFQRLRSNDSPLHSPFAPSQGTEKDDERKPVPYSHVFTTYKSSQKGLPAEYQDHLTQEKINNADWSAVEEMEVSVLLHLLLEWLMQLQEPIVADAIVTTALGRSDIESTIDELSKADKSSFATLQILACFMFQIVPVKPKLIRQLYSALAHILLTNSSLQSTKWEDVIREVSP
ncbi:hypothetical protein R1sor_024089 [Riccia sorocarpa]|uniref:Uncharacterized protein n=1 Tax=Riccia sorocarpa TaxID=122646 RepID=A0ABD3GPM9_9MARC